MKVYFNVCTICSSAKEQVRNLSLIQEISGALGNNTDISFLTLNSVKTVLK